MNDSVRSRNFHFLSNYDPLLAEYGLRAELNAYVDPNTCLLKLRQFGELLARHIAIQAGMDCSEDTFDETLGVLRRQRLIPSEIHGLLNQVRLYGNAAAHRHEDHTTGALQSLICAHELAKWFVVSVLNDDGFEALPFKPLPKPDDATKELRDEIDSLRRRAAEFEAAANATEAEVDALSKRLEVEAEEYQRQLATYTTELGKKESQFREMERESQQRLRQVLSVATSRPLQSFVSRTEQSAWRIGRQDDTLPLTQLRIQSGRDSYCCGEPMVLVQSMDGGFVTQNCSKCNTSRSLSRSDFDALNLFVSCPNCRQRATPAVLGSNYGFQCSDCGWECELAALVPHYRDMQPVD